MKKSFILALVVAAVISLMGTLNLAFSQKPELIVQNGHSKIIFNVAFSPDGKLLASSSSDGFIKLWDVSTGSELCSFPLPDDRVGLGFSMPGGLSFSSDGNTIISVTPSREISSWNIGDRNLLRRIKLPVVYSSASIDGELLVGQSVDRDNTIELWDMLTNQKLLSIPQRSEGSGVVSVFSPDHHSLAFYDEEFIRLWDIKTGKKLMSFSDSGLNYVWRLSFSPDGKTLAAGGKGGVVKLWDAKSGRLMRRIADKSIKELINLEFSPDGKTLAGSVNSGIKLWDISSGREKLSIPHKSEIAYSLAFSPDGKTLVSGSLDSKLQLWDVETGTLIYNFNKSYINADSVYTHPYRAVLASNGGSWDLSTGGLLQTWKTAPSYLMGLSTVFDADWNLMVEADSGYNFKVQHIETGKLERTFSPYVELDKELSQQIFSYAISPNGRLLATVRADGFVKVWNIQTGKEIYSFPIEVIDFAAVKFSLDSKILVCGDQSKIYVWNLANGETLKTIPIKSSAFPLLISSDKKLAATWNGKQKIEVWNLINGERVREFVLKSESDKSFVSVAFSPDYSTIAIMNSEGSLELHNIETGELIPHSAGLPDWIQFNSGFARLPKTDIFALPEGYRVKLFNVVTKQEIASLIVLNEKDWLVTTPEGFFDGTPNAWKQLIWRFNNNTFDYTPVETYFADFFYPNLLQDVLGGKSPKAPAGSELEKKDRRQPKVEIVSFNGQTKKQINSQNLIDKRMATVAVEVTDNTDEKKQPEHEGTSGAQDLRLFRNGSLVKVWHGDAFKLSKADNCEQINKPNEARRVRCLAEVPVVAGENDFTAYVFNLQNVKSGDDSVSVKGADSLKRRGTLFVLAVGVNKYANSTYDLNFAVPDVTDIGAAIKSEQDKIANYQKTEIITLTDENATKDNILLALRRFSEGEKAAIPNDAAEKLNGELSKIKPTQPEDALIIYYAGHGTSKGQRFYLMPHNFTGNDENALRSQGVSDLELNEVLEKVDAGKLLMAIDACQSGQALGGKDDGRAPMNSKGLAQLAYDKGMLILTAAQSQQAALEAVKIGDKEIKHGLLTYALLEGLVKPEADKDGNRQLWEREWLDFAVGQVPQLQSEAMKQRHVEIQKSGRGVEIVYLEGDKTSDPADRKVQTPRVFYRRETETIPLVVAKP